MGSLGLHGDAEHAPYPIGDSREGARCARLAGERHIDGCGVLALGEVSICIAVHELQIRKDVAAQHAGKALPRREPRDPIALIEPVESREPALRHNLALNRLVAWLALDDPRREFPLLVLGQRHFSHKELALEVATGNHRDEHAAAREPAMRRCRKERRELQACSANVTHQVAPDCRAQVRTWQQGDHEPKPVLAELPCLNLCPDEARIGVRIAGFRWSASLSHNQAVILPYLGSALEPPIRCEERCKAHITRRSVGDVLDFPASMGQSQCKEAACLLAHAGPPDPVRPQQLRDEVAHRNRGGLWGIE